MDRKPGRVMICPANDYRIRQIRRCPVCARRRRHVLYDGAWYGMRLTCCGCGDSWSEEGRMERPFQRGWRTEAIARARSDWDAAGAFDREAWNKWLADRIGVDA